MPTVIDSLVVEIGLDPKGARKGANEFQASMKKTRDSASSSSKEIEAYGKRASSFFSSLRNEAIGLFLAFQGASSLTGFVTGLLHSDAATSRLAGNIGVATNRLSAWQLAVGEMNGTAEDANQALGSMRKAYESYMLTGDTGHNPDLAGFGVTLKDLEKPEQALLKIAEAAKKMPKELFYARAQRLGIPDSVINTLEKGRAGVEALVKSKEKDGAASAADGKAAEEFEKQLAKLTAHITGMVRPEMYKLVETFEHLLTDFEHGKKVVPELSNVLIPLAVMAGLAGAPFVALAAAIAVVAVNIGYLQKKWQDYESWWKSLGADTDSIFDPMRKAMGMPSGAEMRAANDAASKESNGVQTVTGTDMAAIAPSGNGKEAIGGNANMHAKLMAAGFSKEQAIGIAAGVTAEGGSLGFSSHVGKHGERAFGIGQWLGGRQKALFKKYGAAPSLDNQVQFLADELHGTAGDGEKGGRSVLRGVTSQDVLIRYLRDFMRPQGAHGEHMNDLRSDIARGEAARRYAYTHNSGGGHKGHTTNIHTVHVNTNPQTAEQLAKDVQARAARRRRLVIQSANRGLDR